MFDLSKALKTFYDDHVRLGNDRRQMLAGHRDANLKRLSDGLRLLKDEGRLKCGPYTTSYTQGSFAMQTLNQHSENDYDIDVGILFDEERLPASALDARNLVAEALSKVGGNFAKEPEARANAVTVWYAEGHHVDFAVYRRREVSRGVFTVEHASTDWRAQDPLEVQEWFDRRVAVLSPKGSAGQVPAGQFRRIVRLVKAFNRSRESWSLPGGMITTALVSECYKSDLLRDDVSLHLTLAAISARLNLYIDVQSPVSPQGLLTAKPEHHNQVKRMRDRLADNLPKLQILFDAKCTDAQARAAWDWIFNHPYWNEKPSTKAQRTDDEAALGTLDIRVDVAFRQNDQPRWMYRQGSALPKNVWLKFTVVRTSAVAPYDVRWLVRNVGDEAEADNGLTHESGGLNRTVQWERTQYKGMHKMICEISQSGVVVARRTVRVQIGSK